MSTMTQYMVDLEAHGRITPPTSLHEALEDLEGALYLHEEAKRAAFALFSRAETLEAEGDSRVAEGLRKRAVSRVEYASRELLRAVSRVQELRAE